MSPIELRTLDAKNADDVSGLQKVLEAAPAYWQRISARSARVEGAAETFAALPENKGYDDKFVLGIFKARELIGYVDLIRGYPDRETAMLGLLLIAETHQRCGAGRASYEAIERLVRAWSGVRKIRIGVVATNSAVLPFWRSLGFEESGLRRPYDENGIVSETIVLEKAL